MRKQKQGQSPMPKGEGIQRKEKQNSRYAKLRVRITKALRLRSIIQMSCFNLMYVYRHYSFSTPTA